MFRFLIGAEQDSSSRASDWQPARSISVVSFPNTEIKSSAQSICNASRNRRTCTDSFQFVEQRIESVSCWRGYGHGGGGAAAAAAGRRESYSTAPSRSPRPPGVEQQQQLGLIRAPLRHEPGQKLPPRSAATGACSVTICNFRVHLFTHHGRIKMPALNLYRHFSIFF